MDITKESEKLLCCMYRIYLERRKQGIPKATAIEFEDGFYISDKHLKKFSRTDISCCLNELKSHKLIHENIVGDVFLEDSSIFYMENRFKNGAKEVLDFLTNLIP